MKRDKADRRINAIAGFREEAKRLEDMGLLTLDAEQKKAIRAYHNEVLADLDGDGRGAGKTGGSIHWGMRLAATGGAIAVVGLGLGALDLLWPQMANWTRVLVAMSLPPLFLLLAEALRAGGRDGYFVILAAGLACLALAMNLKIVTAVFNRPVALEHAVAVGAFATALGHRYASKLLIAAGLVLGASALAGLIALIDGRVLTAALGRLDPLLAVGLAVFSAGLSARISAALRPAWRGAGLLMAGAALIGLAHAGRSILPLNEALAAGLYQAVGAAGLIAALAAGLLNGWREVTYGALALLAVFLFDRMQNWFAPVLSEALQALLLIAVAALFAWLAHLVRRLERNRGDAP